MKMEKGFTLIELMIVIAIIAIIAAIAIPSLLRSTMSGNETSAVQSLHDIQTVEGIIRKQDNDANSIADYWVYDVFGMAAMENPAAAGSPYQAMLDIGVAQSDHRLRVGGWAAPGGGPNYAITMSSSSKAGYYVDALNYYDQNSNGAEDAGEAYPVTLNAAGSTAIGNNNDYGFIAIPATFDRSGLNVYICNAGIAVYTVNSGGMDVEGISPYTQGGAWDLFPGVNPTAITAPSGSVWRKSE